MLTLRKRFEYRTNPQGIDVDHAARFVGIVRYDIVDEPAIGGGDAYSEGWRDYRHVVISPDGAIKAAR